VISEEAAPNVDVDRETAEGIIEVLVEAVEVVELGPAVVVAEFVTVSVSCFVVLVTC
jgi:hypothetical protein